MASSTHVMTPTVLRVIRTVNSPATSGPSLGTPTNRRMRAKHGSRRPAAGRGERHESDQRRPPAAVVPPAAPSGYARPGLDHSGRGRRWGHPPRPTTPGEKPVVVPKGRHTRVNV